MPSPEPVAADFEVRAATEADVPAMLTTLSDGYGRPFTRAWHDWKHLQSPWGRSHPIVAVDAGGMLGVAFALPWHYAAGGVPIVGWRLIDGATTVRAQRRGVFRAVVRGMLDFAAAQPDGGISLATATPEAQLAHIKNGAVALPPIPAYTRPVGWSPARLRTDRAVFDSWCPRGDGRIATQWSADALRWRTDPLSGVDYRVAQLANADDPHGVVYVVSGGSVRRVVVSATWGNTRTVAHALRAIARTERAVAVTAPAGPGTPDPARRIALRRGGSLMCVWDQRSQPSPAADSASGWALQGLDLEGVI